MALPPGAGDVGAALVTNTIADKVVFGDKQAQANAILGGGDEKAQDAGSQPESWDQIVLVLISAKLLRHFHRVLQRVGSAVFL